MTWPTAPLSEVATIDRRAVSPNDLAPGTRYIGLEHIERGGRILGHPTVEEADLASTKFAFDEGHVLFGKLRPNLGKVARPAFTGVCSTDILPIRPGPRLDRAYLQHFLVQPSMVDFAASRASGANLPRLSPGVLAAFAVPIPPLEEQRRIAAILDQSDSLRDKRRQALAHLDDLTQAIFHDMFGDPSDAEQTIRFGDVARLSGGRNLVASDSNATSEYRVLKISAVTTGRFKAEESKPLPVGYAPPPAHLIRDGDLLMSRANTTDLVGAVALVEHAPKNLALPDKIWRFEWLDARSVPVFFHALFRTGAIRRRISRLSSGTGGSMKNVSKSKLESMALPLVPFDRQRDFAARLREANVIEAYTARAAQEEQALFTSLQSRAFRGEL